MAAIARHGVGRPQPLDAASGQDNSGGNLKSRRCAVMPRAQYSRPNSLHAATREEIVVEGVLAHNASLSTTVLGGGLAVVPRQLTAGQKSYTNSGHSHLALDFVSRYIFPHAKIPLVSSKDRQNCAITCTEREGRKRIPLSACLKSVGSDTRNVSVSH